MTTEIAGAISSTSGTGIDEAIVKDPIPPEPASGADDSKSDTPAKADDAPADTPEQQEAKKQSRMQRQRQRQRDAVVAAQTEARLANQRIAQLEAQLKPQQETGEPKVDQFQDYESYLRAVAKHDAKQEATALLKADREASQSRERQQQATQGVQKIANDWTTKETQFQSTVKDYAEVVTPYVEDALGDLSDAARRQILETGPQLLDHLARHPDVHDGIAELSPRDQKAELVKLAATLKAEPPARLPNAPPPLKPIRQGGNGKAGYSDNMSASEYREFRKEGGARWAN